MGRPREQSESSYLMRPFYIAMLLLALVGCAPADDSTPTPPAAVTATMTAAATATDAPTRNPISTRVLSEHLTSTQSSIVEPNTDVGPTPLPTAPDVLVTSGYLPDGAVAQIPAIVHPSAADLAELGEQYAVISDGRSMRVYDVASASLLWSVRFGNDATVKHSPDERWIVATVRDNRYVNHYYIWETATARLAHTIVGSDFYAVASWRNDSKLLILRPGGSNQQGMQLALIDPATNTDIYVIEDQKMEFGHILWTSDGRYLLTANYAHGQILNEIVVRDAATGLRLHEMILPLERTGAGGNQFQISIAHLHFNHDETLVVATYGHQGGDASWVQGVAIVWNVETGEEVWRFEHGDLWDARFSTDGSKVALTATGDLATPLIPVWDAASGELLFEIEIPVVSDEWWDITDAAWSPNSALIALLVEDRIMILDALRGEYIRTLEGTADSIAWSADGEKIRSSVHEWNLVTGEITRLDGAPITGMGELVDMVWLPDGSGVVIAGKQAVQVWGVDNGATYFLRSIRLSELGVPTSRFDGITAIAISPDGSTLATAQQGAVALWDVASGSLRRALIEPVADLDDYQQERFLDVAWSPDSRWVAASGDSTRVWDATSGALIEDIQEASRVVAFSPDELWVTYASNFLRLWPLRPAEPATGEQIELANVLAWTVDGTRIAMGAGLVEVSRLTSSFGI